MPRLRTTLLPLLLALGALVSPRPLSGADPQQPLPEETVVAEEAFLDALNAARERLDLPGLRLDPRLGRAAQHHADDMVERGYHALRSPDGETIDDWVEANGYPVRLLTESVVRSPLGPRELVAEWALSPNRRRGTVFHPEMTELGVGRSVSEGVPLYTLVLARPQAEAAEAEGPAAAGGNLEEVRRRMTDVVNRLRAEEERERLELNPALDRVAQKRAERLAAHWVDGGGEVERDDIYDGLLRELRREGYRLFGLTGVSVLVMSSRLGGVATLEGAVEDPVHRRQILDPVRTHLGIGAAPAASGSGETVWVVLLARATV